MTVPKILEDITLSDRYEDAARNLSLLDFVAVGGGGIKTSVGEDLRGKGVRLLNHYGATEIGALAPIFQPEDGYDWTYLRLRRDIGLTLVTADSDGINPLSCELVGHPFGWDSEFRLQDRLERNPKRPDSEVKVLGRNDDVIVLATGEKVSPHLFERILEANPEIRRAIMFGNGQFECGVLIEPISPVHDSTDDFIESIWPSVVQANALVDSHARIPTRAALVVKPANKDIPLSDKGFPQRGQVYSTFAPEIDHMYNNLLGVQFDDQTMALNPNSMESSLRKMVQMCLPDHIKNGTWSDDEDFIHLGMDSLQATRLRRMLIASLRHSQNLKIENRDLPLDIVYTYPSITRLSRALKQKPGENESGPNCVQEMDTLARKYAIEVKTSNGSRQHGSTILLTGTTGNLGAHLLQHLAESPKVQRLFCLLRRHPTPSPESQADTSEDRQLTALHSRRIELSPVARGKIEFMSWTPGAGLLGLSDAEYQLLVGNVTHIFHGAWPMDFKRKLSSFEPHIKALRDLIDLAQAIYFAQPQIRPKIIFASSIAVAGRHDSMQSSGKVQETPLADPNDPLPMGYAQAKWVCEKMISMVSSYLCTEAGPKVEPIIIRIGQLSGSRLTGFWSPREHIPALVKASQDIGAMPDVSGVSSTIIGYHSELTTEQTLSWLPVDQAARVVSELILGPTAGQLVYHVENPVRQKWRDVLTIIERKLGLSSSKRMPFQEWLSQISKGKDAPESLFEFYRNHFLQMSTGVVVLDTQACRSSSPTMRSTGGVKVETIELYIDFWKSSGLLK